MSDRALAPDREVTQLDEVENTQSTTQTRGETPNEAHVDNPPGAASSILFSVSVDIHQQLPDSASC